MASFSLKQTSGVMSRGSMTSSQRQELLTQSGTIPKKGYWFPDEDQKLIQLYQAEGGNVDWAAIAAKFENRTAKQCRERWNEYLSPNIDHSPFTVEEDFIILRSQARLGNKWKEITDLLPVRDPRKKRTPTSVKVQWHCLERRIRRSGTSYLGNQWTVGEFDPSRIPQPWIPASPRPPTPAYFTQSAAGSLPLLTSTNPADLSYHPQSHSPNQMMSLPGVDSISSSNNALDSSNYLLYQSTTPSILGPRTFSQYDDETQGLEEHSSTFFCEPKEKHSHEEVKEATSLEQQDEVSNCETLPQATPSSTSTPNPTAVYQIDVNSDTASKIFNHIMNSNQMSFPHLPNSVPTARANSVACPPLYVTAQLPHLISHPGADYSIFSSTGPFGPFSPCQFLSMFDHQPQFSPFSSVQRNTNSRDHY